MRAEYQEVKAESEQIMAQWSQQQGLYEAEIQSITYRFEHGGAR